MTSASIAVPPAATRQERRTTSFGAFVWDYMTTTDHKKIGRLYFGTSLFFFAFGGILALLIRAELAYPGMQFMHQETFNQLFTMHGTIMLLMFATPLFSGFANYFMPLQIGAPDVAFPRINQFAYWLYLFGSLMACSGFLTPGGAASFGWFAYAPLSDAINSPGVGGDLWVMGLYLLGLSSILGAVNFVTTIILMRTPGMTMFRMPIFSWNILITSIMVLVVFPVLSAGLLVLEADRALGAHIFDAANGGPILWQHLFWFFGHPEVYVIALPFFGIITEVLPVFSRKPVFGYVGLVFATLAIGGLSVSVWAHHMFVTGAVSLPFFSFMTFTIAVPTGVKFFNWIGTMWGGKLVFASPMIWALGFLVTFLFGGLTGVLLASPPLDFHLSDSYFVVAHFHYVLFGTVVVGNPTHAMLLAVSILAGITYAGMANIMLGSLGVVLAPKHNQGYLPGLNGGAFNLGAGLSFTIVFAVFTATGGNYRAGMIAGADSIEDMDVVRHGGMDRVFAGHRAPTTLGTHLRAYIPLWIGAVLFFMISEQAAGKMATFAKDYTDGHIPLIGWVLTPETYQSINPATIVILAPFIGWLFTRRAGRFPSTIMKFAISVLTIGTSAFILGYGFQIWPGGAKLSPWWFLAVVFIIQTVAELFLSPVGLSTTSALAPKNFASQTMSLWLLTTATGQGLAGFIISRTENVANSTYYYGLGVATLLMALVLFAVAPWTQRQMADVETATAE